MKTPVEKLLEINHDPKARVLFEAREKQRRDNMARERRARQEGKRNKAIDVAKKMLQKMPIDTIIDLTGLSGNEIEELNKVQ